MEVRSEQTANVNFTVPVILLVVSDDLVVKVFGGLKRVQASNDCINDRNGNCATVIRGVAQIYHACAVTVFVYLRYNLKKLSYTILLQRKTRVMEAALIAIRSLQVRV